LVIIQSFHPATPKEANKPVAEGSTPGEVIHRMDQCFIHHYDKSQ